MQLASVVVEKEDSLNLRPTPVSLKSEGKKKMENWAWTLSEGQEELVLQWVGVHIYGILNCTPDPLPNTFYELINLTYTIYL